MLVEVFQVRGEGSSFVPPVSQAKEGTDANSTEAASIGALGALEAPVEIFLRPCGVKSGVGVTIVCLLIDNEPLGSMTYELTVLLVFHGANLNANGGDKSLDGINAVLQVAFTDKLRVLSGNEKDVAKAERMQVPCLCDDLINRECSTQDGIITREAAVAAVVDALVGDVERGEEPHGFAEVAAGDGAAIDSHRLDFLTRLWR